MSMGGARGFAMGPGVGGHTFAMGHGGFGHDHLGHGFGRHRFVRDFGFGGLYDGDGGWGPDYDYGYCNWPYSYDPYGQCYGYGW
ncbi:MAG: hypothetical protein WBF03_16960 [Xanthobacteraceae bacterium]